MACVKPGFQNDSTRGNYMNFVLYWFPFSGSLAPMAVLEEVGVPYKKTLIDISKGEHLSPEYLKIHPLGLVPAFRLENGKYIFESAGICMYLADLFPEYKLAPPFDGPGRGVYNQWMVVEKALENRSWLIDEKFSIADIYMLMLSTWDEDEDEFALMFPNVTRVAASTAKRRGVQRALRLHSV